MDVSVISTKQDAGAGCPRCGYANAPVARFCSDCGLRLRFFCWNCGGANRTDATFCQTCGVRLTERPESDAVIAGAFGPAVAQIESATPSNGASGTSLRADEAVLAPRSPTPDGLDEERRVVTVLFADIVGSTALGELLDAEEVREILATAMGKLVEATAIYGGTVDKFIGDAVMALFGAPTAHQDDPVRALHAGLAMQRAISELEVADHDGLEVRLQLRIGINTGEVVAGSRDVAGYREYSVFGDVVNTAARLQTAAPAGGILVGEATARQTGATFRLESVEPLDLKGKGQPVAAWRVLGTDGERSGRSAESPSAARSPVVGRITETKHLREHFQDLARGRGQIVSIIAEHGMGKSRVVGDLRSYAEELGLRWGLARAPSYSQGLSYRMFRETIQELFEIQDGDPDDVAAERVRAGLAELGVEAAYPHVAFPLGLPRDAETEAALRDLSGEQLQARAFDAVRSFFRALAERQPLIMVLDDLQWADPSSIDLLAHLMPLCDEVPILFYYLFTPERDAACWTLKELAQRSFPHRYDELVLTRLTDQAAHDLMCSLLECAETPANLEALVLAKAEGNPYFIEEVLRSLTEQGTLRREGERWLATTEIDKIHIPDTLLATVTARLDRLPEGVRRTLQTAAVIGREFSARVLAQVIPAASLERHLRDAQRAGLIREEAAIPERRYAFSQVLIQEAALGSLLLRRRRELHVQVGWAIEELYADELDEQYGDLAEHFYQGEDWERAFRYHRLAAEQAARTYANEEAVRGYTRALYAAERSAAGADPEVVAGLTERRGDVRTLVGDFGQALVDYEAALEHHQRQYGDGREAEAAEEAHHVGTLALKLARTHSFRGDVPAMERWLELAFAELPDNSPDLSFAWSYRALALTGRGHPEEAAETAARAMALAKRSGLPAHLHAAYQALTHPGLISVLGPQSGEHARRWVALAREQGHPIALFRALAAHAFIRTWAHWTFDDESLAEATEALELARTISSPTADSTARGILGAGLFLLGRWDEAERELRRVSYQPTMLFGQDAINHFWLARLLTLRGVLDEALGIIRFRLDGRHNPHVQMAQHAQLALNRRLADDEASAEAAMERAAQAMNETGCTHCRVFFHAAAAEFYAESGDATVAAEHVDQARELGTRTERPPAVLAARRGAARLHLRAGDADSAIQELLAAQVLASSIGQPFELAQTTGLLAQAYRARGDAEQARRCLTSTLETFRALRAEPYVAATAAMLRELEPQPKP